MTLLIGDKSEFAIESSIQKAYARLSFMTLGYFLIYVGGRCYGVHEPDATMLGCSLSRVEELIVRRGQHLAPFANDPRPGAIADAYRDAIYAPEQEGELFLGFSREDFCAIIYSSHLVWAPDGDEAFDDGSFVLIFDVENRVRLIAFRCADEGYHHAEDSLREIWLNADRFYLLLAEWRNRFLRVWNEAPKISEADDGAESS